MTNEAISIFWFRRDLRLDDNHGLHQALEAGRPVLALFIFDKKILDPLTDRRDKRVNFIYQTVSELDQQLVKKGSSLLAMHDNPLAAFQKIITRFRVESVYTNHDYEPYAIQRDQEVSAFLASKNIRFFGFKDQVIFEKSEILKSNGEPYTVFTPYSRSWKQRLHEEGFSSYPSERRGAHFIKTKPFDFPRLVEIGFEESGFIIPPPHLDVKTISQYEKMRNLPSADATTKVSPHLRFGTVSVRKLVSLARELSESWLNELIWREFFMMILFRFPRVVIESFKKKYDEIQWRNNEAEFSAWCRGETGYPLVDAGMRELNETGFMHNRVRLVVASFLAKHLLVDWRWGEAYFAEKLVDYELSSNNGNWQWAAGSGCDAAPYFRIFNPTLQTKKFDPTLAYIKKWIENFSAYHIPPIVDHEFARKRALAVYQSALRNS